MKKSTGFLALLILLCLSSISTANIKQGNWRWLNNDGADGAATSIANENTAITIQQGDTFRLRLELYNDDSYGANYTGLILKYNDTNDLNSNFWQDVGSSGIFDYHSSTHLTDGATTSADVLAESAGTAHTAGGFEKDQSGTTDLNLTGMSSYEYDISLKLNTPVEHGKTYHFALFKTNQLAAYAVLPSLTIEDIYDFTAAQIDRSVRLQWKTDAEVSVAGYVLKRKIESSAWEEVANWRTESDLVGQGTSASLTNYEFTDDASSFHNGHVWTYRLSQELTGGGTVTAISTVSIELLEKITVSGASGGSAGVNGIYNWDDPNLYVNGSNYDIYHDESQWLIRIDNKFTMFYSNHNTSRPPTEGWQVGAAGNAPIPTLSGSGVEDDYIIIEGAGSSLDTYYERSSYPQADGRYYYESDNSHMVVWQNNRWEIYNSVTLVYFNASDTPTPPTSGWQVAPEGASPTPSISGPDAHDASLSVEISAFSAQPIPGGIQISWTTESETDNLGYILERRMDDTKYTTIASYQSHPALCGQGNSSERFEYMYIDTEITSGTICTYRLSDVNTIGEVHIYDIIKIVLPDAPLVTLLEPPYPNPFNPQTKIEYHLAESGPVEIAVYDLLGRKVRVLVNKVQGAGSYNMYWHGDDTSGNQTATGTYLIVLKTNEGVKTQKAVMIQ